MLCSVPNDCSSNSNDSNVEPLISFLLQKGYNGHHLEPISTDTPPLKVVPLSQFVKGPQTIVFPRHQSKYPYTPVFPRHQSKYTSVFPRHQSKFTYPPTSAYHHPQSGFAFNDRYKTTLCKAFTHSGMCEYANRCLFAHGEAELRPNPNYYFGSSDRSGYGTGIHH